MGRNIDLIDMIDKKQTKCIKCKHYNDNWFEEFDIDCYEFQEGICEFEFECNNCNFNNEVKIVVDIRNRNLLDDIQEY